MPLRSDHLQAVWWLAVAAAISWILWLLSPILTPFLAGAVLAYILDPAVEWLVRRRIPRPAGVALVLLLGLFGLLAVFLIVAPLIRTEATELAGRLPGLLDRLDAALAPWLKSTVGRDVHVDLASLKQVLTEHLQASEGLFGRLLDSARSGGLALVGWLANLVLIPVVLFYLLLDWQEIVARVDGLVPSRR